MKRSAAMPAASALVSGSWPPARHGVHRRTVRQALASPTPPPRKPRSFAAPRLDAAKPLIDAMLREDLDAPRKRIDLCGVRTKVFLFTLRLSCSGRAAAA